MSIVIPTNKTSENLWKALHPTAHDATAPDIADGAGGAAAEATNSYLSLVRQVPPPQLLQVISFVWHWRAHQPTTQKDWLLLLGPPDRGVKARAAMYTRG